MQNAGFLSALPIHRLVFSERIEAKVFQKQRHLILAQLLAEELAYLLYFPGQILRLIQLAYHLQG